MSVAPGACGRRSVAVALGLGLAWPEAPVALGASADAPGAAVETTPASAAPLGVYLGPGCQGAARMADFARWLGRRPDRASDFLADTSWRDIVKAAERSTRCWTPQGLPMSVAVPMLPRDGSASLQEGAAGTYDSHFADVARILVAQGQAEAVVRIGWEFNHDWYPWRASAAPQAWPICWRRIVDSMRGVAGAQFRFDWCVGWGQGKVDPAEVYPGDDVVDIIGMDIYNTTWNPRTPQERWRIKSEGAFGLHWQRAFARAHGKPMSYPEWGTGLRPDGRGGGDDPLFIERMAAWIRSNDVAYHNYWDFHAPDYKATLSDGSQPAAAAAFLTHFGRRP